MKFRKASGISVLLVALAVSSCTSIKVKPVTAMDAFHHLCIEENPRVIVPDFVAILQRGLDRHDISSEIFNDSKPAHCDYVLSYTARRSWDFTPYMTHAELRIDRHGRHIASAQYHLRGKGGLSLTKWKSTESKMTPVIDQLLSFNTSKGIVRTTSPSVTPDSHSSPVVSLSAPTDQPLPPKFANPGPSVRIDSKRGPESAAQAVAHMRNCNGPLSHISIESDRQVYSASCWGSKKIVISCSQEECRELQ